MMENTASEVASVSHRTLRCGLRLHGLWVQMTPPRAVNMVREMMSLDRIASILAR